MKALDSTHLGRPKLETFIVTGQQLSRFDGPCDLWRRFRIERPVQEEKDPLQARGMETNTAQVSSHRLRLTQVCDNYPNSLHLAGLVTNSILLC